MQHGTIERTRPSGRVQEGVEELACIAEGDGVEGERTSERLCPRTVTEEYIHMSKINHGPAAACNERYARFHEM